MKLFLKKQSPYQHTVRSEVRMSGIGLHSGRPVLMHIKPAEADSGIRFFRTDLQQEIPALMDRVVDTRLATTLGENGVSISTTEHLLAALSGIGIDNARIELNGPEVPIMDGSAGPFVHLLKKIDRCRQASSRRLLKITREIALKSGETEIRVVPHDGMKITCEIDFDHQLIRRQSYSFEMDSKRFVKEIASARTFGFMDQVEQLRANGLALGGSLENAVVMDQSRVLNTEGLRFTDEFVRHKVLDLIGDLALLGCPIVGHVIASRPGHGQHLALMKEIIAHPECWEFITLEKTEEPGMLSRVVTTTKAARSMFTPYLVPPATVPAGLSSSLGGS
ncbi:MAG: UDP-3-O-acyl-N-acetylglucosamine deacetylase [Proteobacteria bacterium]|nr:UDP-3-O-acyl-N-acetylglucosamine deacetylase [Pseudomonadota bacterium]MBU1688617.1 UDP-3-O-acyl-N-acetylglucosamine deacetylase [Pseudomonadota bacterium]